MSSFWNKTFPSPKGFLPNYVLHETPAQIRRIAHEEKCALGEYDVKSICMSTAQWREAHSYHSALPTISGSSHLAKPKLYPYWMVTPSPPTLHAPLQPPEAISKSQVQLPSFHPDSLYFFVAVDTIDRFQRFESSLFVFLLTSLSSPPAPLLPAPSG